MKKKVFSCLQRNSYRQRRQGRLRRVRPKGHPKRWKKGQTILSNPAANLNFRSLISDEETRQMIVITENNQASFQINFGALSEFETGPHLVSPNDVENYNSEIEQTYLDKARQYVLLNRVSVTNLVAYTKASKWRIRKNLLQKTIKN
jgi:hypothetical protein